MYTLREIEQREARVRKELRARRHDIQMQWQQLRHPAPAAEGLFGRLSKSISYATVAVNGFLVMRKVSRLFKRLHR